MRVVALTLLWVALGCHFLGAQTLTCMAQPASGLFYTDEAGVKREAAQWSCIVEGGTATPDEIRAAMWQMAPFTDDTVKRLSEWVNRRTRKHWILKIIEYASWAGPAIPAFVEIHEDKWKGILVGLPAATKGLGKLLGDERDEFVQQSAAMPWYTVYSRQSSSRGFQISLGRTPQPEPPALPPGGAPTLTEPTTTLPVAWQTTTAPYWDPRAAAICGEPCQ